TGGIGKGRCLNSSELYDLSSGTWTTAGSMNYPRDYHTASVLKNGKVLVSGGESVFGLLSTTELYDSSTGTWTTTGNMNYARNLHTESVLTNGKMLIIGEDNYEVLNIAELYSLF
ncbi:unnamed protein product, partial [Rotaria sp. Silwood1]